jgi:hypothetical protein
MFHVKDVVKILVRRTIEQGEKWSNKLKFLMGFQNSEKLNL